MLQTNQDVYDLLNASYDLPRGSFEKIELLERAIALADSLNDIELGATARNEFIEACEFGGYPEKSLVAFAWLLAKFDEHGEETGISGYDIIWKYKWILNDLWGFPRISHEQIEKTLVDFEARLLKGGYGLRTLHYFQLKYALHCGDEDADKKLYAVWQKTKRDGMSDCVACEVDFQADYLISKGDYETALEVAAPILKGRMTCAEVPHLTYAMLLEPLLHLQRFDEAVTLYQKGYKMVKGNQEFLIAVGQHMAFLAYTHNVGTALSLFERHLPWALATADMERRFEFYASSLPLLERLKERGDMFVKVRVHKEFSVQGSDEGLELARLEHYIKTDLAELAKQFDSRNKTAAFTGRLGVDHELLEHTPKITVSKPRTKTLKEH